MWQDGPAETGNDETLSSFQFDAEIFSLSQAGFAKNSNRYLPMLFGIGTFLCSGYRIYWSRFNYPRQLGKTNLNGVQLQVPG